MSKMEPDEEESAEEAKAFIHAMAAKHTFVATGGLDASELPLAKYPMLAAVFAGKMLCMGAAEEAATCLLAHGDKLSDAAKRYLVAVRDYALPLDRSNTSTKAKSTMAQHPDDGMYSIKLIHPEHLGHEFFTPTTSNSGVPRLMNFSDNHHTRAIVDGIRVGHKAIIYVTKPIQKFIWAIEYTGTVRDGEQAAARCQLPADLPLEWRTTFLPIRFLATIIDVASAPDAQDILQRSGVDFIPGPYPMKYISAVEYQKLYDAINWQLIAPCEKAGASCVPN